MKVQDILNNQQLTEQAVADQAATLLESASSDELVLSAPQDAEDVIAELFK